MDAPIDLTTKNTKYTKQGTEHAVSFVFFVIFVVKEYIRPKRPLESDLSSHE